jgi:hypothetical protein
VVLSEPERARLHPTIGRGAAPANALTQARILLRANQGEAGLPWIDAAIGGGAGGQPRHRGPGPHAVRRGGAGRRGVPQAARALLPLPAGREQETRLVTLTCSAPPQGHKRWTLRLLADRLVEEVSTGPYDPRRPQVCLDETSGQLLGEVNPPHPVVPGPTSQTDRIMSTSTGRCAACSWWPSRLLAGATSWSALGAPGSTGRTPVKDLVDGLYPDAEQIVQVQYNLNIHTPASLYEAFASAKAKRLARLHQEPGRHPTPRVQFNEKDGHSRPTWIRREPHR